MFNKGQLAGLMKQAQAMQDNLKKAQEELAHIEVEGESGAGLVKVVMTCKHDVKRITIDPSLLADDKDMLEDLVAAAFNAALRKAEETSACAMVPRSTYSSSLPAGTPRASRVTVRPRWRSASPMTCAVASPSAVKLVARITSATVPSSARSNSFCRPMSLGPMPSSGLSLPISTK